MDNTSEEMICSHQVKRFFKGFLWLCGGLFRKILKKLFIWRLKTDSPNKIEFRRPFFLIILYGTLEYDGRAQRLLEVLKPLGDIFVIDVESQQASEDIRTPLRRKLINMPDSMGKVRRHLRFWRIVLAEIIRNRPQVIISANFFSIFPGQIGAILTGSRFIYDAYELIIPEPGGKMSWRDRFWYWMERLVIRYADLVIAANEERAQLMQVHYSLKHTPVVMRNIPPMRNISEEERETTLTHYPEIVRRHSKERLVLYQGNVDLSRGIDRFVRALAHLGTEYRLIIVGGGPDSKHLKAIGEPFEREDRFVILGRVPHCQLSAITTMADVGIVTYPYQGLNNIYCASNKLFEYIQAGLPVVATNQPPLRRLVESYGIGKLVGEHDSPEQIAEAIRAVAENKRAYVRSLTYFLSDHRWENEAERVRGAIVNILIK